MDDLSSPMDSGTDLPEGQGYEEKAPVLVVDDSRVIRTYLQTLLEQEGYEVIQAKNGSEAMDLLTEEVGLVLLDLWMPGMDGMTCLDLIHKDFPDTPAIMITMSHEITHVVEAMKYGAYDFITKPFNPRALIALVEQAMKARNRACRLRRVESALRKAREREASIAAKIQQTLLPGGHPGGFSGVKIGEFTVPSKNIDGDFYDFFRLGDQCFDVIIGDVMGKGIPAALLGAAARHHIMSVLFRLVTTPGHGAMPSAGEIVGIVHGEMAGKMKDLETFFTLCYARFDLSRELISYVDCGHTRTIHYHSTTGYCSLLQGVNMPLGFPGQDQFTQIQAPFSPGDLFFFYSDGLTEAKSPEGGFYGEERLLGFIKGHCFLDPQDLCRKAWREIVDFSQSDAISDDFTCVAVRIEGPDDAGTRREWNLEVRTSLEELEGVRAFIHDICRRVWKRLADEECIARVQGTAGEIMTGIISRASRGGAGETVYIEARALHDELVLTFYDRGPALDADQSDPAGEGGFSLNAIRQAADHVRYTRDENGLNCLSVGFSLQRKEIA